jgi:hypothetical protein
MDNLLPGVLNRIVLYLERYTIQQGVAIIQQQSPEPSELPPYATISKQWKEAIDLVTLHQLRIRSDELNQFRAIVTHHRRKHLCRLSYEILLTEYSEEKFRQVESKEEQESNNEAFAQGIKDLVYILRQWEEAGVFSELRLGLNQQSPTDQYEFERRCENSFLALSGADSITPVSRIRYLNIQGNCMRRTSPSVLPGLAAFLSNLKHLYGEFCDEVGEQAVEVENRIQFAKMLE